MCLGRWLHTLPYNLLLKRPRKSRRLLWFSIRGLSQAVTLLCRRFHFHKAETCHAKINDSCLHLILDTIRRLATCGLANATPLPTRLPKVGLKSEVKKISSIIYLGHVLQLTLAAHSMALICMLLLLLLLNQHCPIFIMILQHNCLSYSITRRVHSFP